MLSLYSAASVREMDKILAKQLNCNLMSLAAAAILQKIKQILPQGKLWLIAGPGNNGGDVLTLAPMLRESGYDFELTLIGEPKTPEATAALKAWQAEGGVVSDSLDVTCDLVVDGLLGSGLSQDVSGQFQKAISAINQNNAMVLAVDCPSGLDSSTGSIRGDAVIADHTITFVGHKIGLHTHFGPDYAGKVHFAPLCVQPLPYPADVVGLTESVLEAWPLRPHECHKNDFGPVFCFGGDAPGMSGSILLSAISAFSVGAGYVNVISKDNVAEKLAALCPEAIFTAESPVRDPKVVLAGPGLVQTDKIKNLLADYRAKNIPMVLDAGALQYAEKYQHQIITPHVGEAAKLLDVSIEQIQADRVSSAKELANRFGGTVVLKGCGTVIASEKEIAIAPVGTPMLATAGAGDVLAGVIAGLVAEGATLHYAACLATWAHAIVGESLAHNKPSLRALDLALGMQDVWELA